MTKDIWWAGETNFNNWVGKHRKYPIYAQQKDEVLADIEDLCKRLKISKPKILDVGGGDGRLELGDVIDASKGDDITSDECWKKIGQYDIVITSLVLVTLSEEMVDYVLKQMFSHATKAIYLYEETPAREARECGDIVSSDYGPKYSHDLISHLEEIATDDIRIPLDGKNIEAKMSSFSDHWIRYIIDL